MDEPFIGSEALAAGLVRKHQLRSLYRAFHRNVYFGADTTPNLRQRTTAAWLWSHRRGVIAGLAASALHGSKYVDDDVPVELIHPNARPPSGIITRADHLLDNEYQRLGGLAVTTPERTAFDLGRRGPLTRTVARLDALTRATGLTAAAVEELAGCHPHARGLRQLEKALGLIDGGAESPQETWLRLLLIRAGYPRPRTQIPVVSSDGLRRYRLDLGWEDIMLAVEYDGDHHRTDRERWAYEIQRAEDIQERRWRVVRVTARHRTEDVLRRVDSAYRSRIRSK